MNNVNLTIGDTTITKTYECILDLATRIFWKIKKKKKNYLENSVKVRNISDCTRVYAIEVFWLFTV